MAAAHGPRRTSRRDQLQVFVVRTRRRFVEAKDKCSNHGILGWTGRRKGQDEEADKCSNGGHKDATSARDAHGEADESQQPRADCTPGQCNEARALERLSDPEWQLVASFLDVEDAVNLSLTCKGLNFIIFDYARHFVKKPDDSYVSTKQKNWLLRYVNSRVPHEYMCWQCMKPHDWQAWRRAMASREYAVSERLAAGERVEEYIGANGNVEDPDRVLGYAFGFAVGRIVPMLVSVPKNDCYLELTRWNGFNKEKPHNPQLCGLIETMISPTRPWYFHESALIKRAKVYKSLEYGLSLSYATNTWVEKSWEYTTEPLFVKLKKCGVNFGNERKFDILVLKVRSERTFSLQELETFAQALISRRQRYSRYEVTANADRPRLDFTSCECGLENISARMRKLITQHEIACGHDSKQRSVKKPPKLFPRVADQDHLCSIRYTCWWCSAQYHIQLGCVGPNEHLFSVERYIDLGPAEIWHLGGIEEPLQKPLFPSDTRKLSSFGYQWSSSIGDGCLKTKNPHGRNLKQLYCKQVKTNAEKGRKILCDGTVRRSILKRSSLTTVLLKDAAWHKQRAIENRKLEIKLGKRPAYQARDADDAASLCTIESIPSEVPVSPGTYIAPIRKMGVWGDDDCFNDAEKLEAGPSGTRDSQHGVSSVPIQSSELLKVVVPTEVKMRAWEDSAACGVIDDCRANSSASGTSSSEGLTSSPMVIAHTYTNTTAPATTLTPESGTYPRKESYSSNF